MIKIPFSAASALACDDHFVQWRVSRGMELERAFGQDSFMINPDEDLPKPAKSLLVPPLLDMLGIDELEAYVATLEAEIARVKRVISAKDAHKQAAAAFFKTPRG